MPSSGYRKQTMDFSEMSRDLQNAAASFTKMSAAAAGFVSLVGAFKTFELEVTKANAAIGGSAKTYKQLADAARNFALVSKYSAGEAAGSMVMLAQAGFDAQETMAAMPHVLQLAQASMENLDLVADTVASTIRTFNMSADEASRVTNVFAASCVNSLATVNKLAFSFRQVGPVAAELGMNIEQTAAALDVLYNRGLRGEQAGTALRNILIRLIKPTKDTQEAFSNLGIGLKNADGSARDLQAILGDLRKANINDTYLAKIFGREALAASKTLIAATAGEYEKMKDAITDTNTVARMANAQLNTLDGALKLIKNSLNELGIIMGETVTPVVKSVGSIIQDIAIALRNADSSTISTIKNFTLFVTAIGAGKFALTKIITETNKLIAVGSRATSIFSTLGDMLTFKKSGAGLLTLKGFANELRMFEIAQSSGTDWYTNVNEFYKSINNGKGITMKAALEMKNLTAAQVAYRRSVLAGAAATKTFGSALKAAGLAAGKFLLIAAALTAAFKVFDVYMQSRERKKQQMNDLFPEIEYLDQKIKELKKTTANDLPAIVKQYKEAIDSMSTAQEEIRRISLQGVTVVDGKVTVSPELKKGIERLKEETIKQIDKYGTINEQDLRDIAEKNNISYTLLEEYLKGVRKRLEDLNDTVSIGPGMEAYTIKRSKEAAQWGARAVSDMIELNKDALENYSDQVKQYSELVETKVTNMISELTDAGAKVQWLVGNAAGKELTDKVKKGFIDYLVGVSYIDAARALQERRDELKSLLEEHKNDLTPILDDFRKNFLPQILTSKELSIVSPEEKVEIEGEVKVTPLNLSQQESALQALRKSVSDMMSDYKITWELLSTEQVAIEKLKGIEQQYGVNRLNTLKEQKDLIQKIFDLTSNGALSVAAVEKTLGNIDTDTGKWLDKERLLAEINKNKDPEVRKMAAMYLEQVELKGKEYTIQNKLLDKERERLTVIDGHFKYQKEYTAELERQIAIFDKQATVGTEFWKNVDKGLASGLLSVETQINSAYDMAKLGMQGLAEYMSDSLYTVIDNWDKGWDSMKEALRSTLVEMLRDMAKYFAKMAAYSAAVGIFGGMFGNAGKQVYDAPIGPTQPGTFNGLSANTVAAKGGVWHKGLQTFAKGGVVGSPTLFNTRSGKGLMGEAGPEAIIPLKRDRDGNLGVSVDGNAGNSYSSTIVINAQTGTAEVKSDANYDALAKKLDEQIRGVVLTTLVREKKPGGILA